MYKYLLLVFLSLAINGWGQIGGINTYEFLNLSPSARISGLGGNLITVRDDDINLGFNNPAALNPSMHNALSFNHNFHVAGINSGYAAYGHFVKKWETTVHGGIKYVGYGDFDQTDEFGQVTGTFNASEYAITVGASKELYERLSVGVNAKLITSQLESYNSLGVVADVAAMYHDTASNFMFTVVFRNMGTQLSTYDGEDSEPLPFEIQLGLSKRLKYLPFRFSIIYHHFDRWNILFDDPNSEEPTSLLGEEPTERSSSSIWFDNFARHFIFNGEFLFGKKDNFRLRVGYNHFLNRELSVENFRSLAGFSFGAGIKINRFRLDYGRTTFHLAGGLNHIGISTNIKEFKKG